MKSLPVSHKPVCAKSVKVKIDKFANDFKKELKRLEKERSQKGGFIFSDDWREVSRRLAKKWSLKRRTHDGVSGIIYISRKKGFVVKRPYFPRGEKIPKHAIYTKKISYNPYDAEYYFGSVCVQPIAKVDQFSRYLAYDAIDRSCYPVTDLHEGNVGIYNGKAVAIDW